MLALRAKTDKKVEILLSVPGVGVVTTSTLNSDKKRKVRGGRSQVRCVLYMAAFVAARHNKTIKRFYDHLVARGKLPKVACSKRQATHRRLVLKKFS